MLSKNAKKHLVDKTKNKPKLDADWKITKTDQS